MKRWLPIAVVVMQVAMLGFMAGEREWIATMGTKISLRTAPIDPQDPMRGDYVRLNYEISRLPRNLCRDGTEAWFDQTYYDQYQWRDRVVYAELKLGNENIAEIVSLSDRKPESGLFIRGRVESVTQNSLFVRYGVEAFFMEQGAAREFENAVRNEKVGVPVNAEVAVGSNGLAVLTGYRWEPLGIALRFEWAAQESDPANALVPRRMTAVTVELKNHSDEPVAVVDRRGGGSFRLNRNDQWSPNTYRWVGEDSEMPAASARDVIVLQPGETHETILEFTEPKWFVTKINPDEAGQPVSIGDLGVIWTESFRIEYLPPSAEECVGFPNAELIRHAALRSRAFFPSQGVD